MEQSTPKRKTARPIASKGSSTSTPTSRVKSNATKPKPRESVFDRMSKTDTFATRGAKARGTDRRDTAIGSSLRARRTTPKASARRTSTTAMKPPDTARGRSRNKTLKKSPSSISAKSSSSRPSSSRASSRKSKQSSSQPSSRPPAVEPSKPKEPINARQSIKAAFQGRRQSVLLTSELLGLELELNDDLDEGNNLSLDNNHDSDLNDLDPVFKSCFPPKDMRCLALVAHNHMKPPMKKFVMANKNLLRHFVLTGTNTTMTMLREVFGDDPDVHFGPVCTSGPLGGDAELVAIMCTERLGGCVFFQDPMSSHPHIKDIECLTRQANVHNVIMMPNPASAHACMTTFRIALKEGKAELIPSFFQTLVSPSVEEYKVEQAKVLELNSEDHEDYS